MKAVLLLVVVCVAYCAAYEVEFVGNVTLQGDKNNWNFRATTLSDWDYDPADGDGISFTSISAGGSNTSLNGDAVWGKAQIQTFYPPIVWLQYASLDIYYLNNVNAQGAYGLIANAYVRLEETAPNGTVVKVQSLREALLESAFGWDTDKVGSSEDLKWVSFIGKVPSESWTIKLTFILSNVVGVINVADAVVTPKSLESIVEINGWVYESPENTLSLVLAVASGNTAIEGTAVVTKQTSEKDQVYFSVSEQAVVGGELTNVSVSAYAKASYDATFEDPDFLVQLSALYGANVDTQQVIVTFPAGATDILYDPTIGASYQAEEAASIYFVGNVSLEGDQDNYKFRLTTLNQVTTDNTQEAAFTSISFDGNNQSLNGDSVWGQAKVQNSYPPTVTLQYASLDIYYRNLNQGSYGLIANAYVRLEETAPNGTVVRTQSLRQNIQPTPIVWTTGNVGSSENLKFISFTGSVAGEPWTITLTFIVSNVVGVVNTAGAVVTPKSLESIVEITDWVYQSPENTLSLVLAVASGEAEVQGTVVVSTNTEAEDQVFFSVSKKAVVAGEVTDVSVSGYSQASYEATFVNQDVKASLAVLYGAKINTQQVTVTFPAGATDITYDPTIGAQTEASSAISLLANVFLALALAAALLL